MDLIELLFLLLLAIIAFFYASVGHGGASGYLALMSLFAYPAATLKPTALVLNIFVSGAAFFFFNKQKHFRWKLFYPFALSSIPAAFIGGYLQVDPLLYKKILAALLLFAIARMLNLFGTKAVVKKQPSF